MNKTIPILNLVRQNTTQFFLKLYLPFFWKKCIADQDPIADHMKKILLKPKLLAFQFTTFALDNFAKWEK